MANAAVDEARVSEGLVDGIERDPGRCGGYPVLTGHRISVRNIVEYLRTNQSHSIDDFMRDFPHLRRDQVEAALVYYARNPHIVNEDINRHRESWAAMTGQDYGGDPAVP